MAGFYTHFAFGRKIEKNLSQKKLIEKYQNLFDLGNQGPDMFYFSKLSYKNKLRYGELIHKQPGMEFFKNTKAVILQKGFESPHFVYIMGALAHFVVDVYIHPVIDNLVETKKLDHHALETELDRINLRKIYGQEKISTDKLINFTKQDLNVIEEIYKEYPKTDYKLLKNAYESMKNIKKFVNNMNPVKQKIVFAIMKLAKQYQKNSGIVMTVKEREEKNYLEEIQKYLEKAQRDYPQILDNLINYYKGKEELGDIFKYNYSGK